MQGIAFSLQRSRGTQSPMSESHGCHFKPFPYKETPKMVICLKLIFFSFCQYCKSLLCSMFNEQTCSRFTRLFVRLFKNKLFGCFHLFRILHVLHVLRTYSMCSHLGSGTASSNIYSIGRVPFSPIPLAFDPEHCCCCS